MGVVLTNNATSTLVSSITSSATSLSVQSADASRFPSLGAEDWFPLTIVDEAGNMEIVKVTARSSATLTIERAQEGTTAASFSAGARVDLRLTAGAVAAMMALDFATEAEAKAGTNALKPMNALRTKQSIETVAISGTRSAINALATANGLLAGQMIYLTDEQKFAGATGPGAYALLGAEVASQAEALAGTDNAKMMTPLRVKQALAELTLAVNRLQFAAASFGTFIAGGYYAGTITYSGKTYALIMAPKESGGESATALKFRDTNVGQTLGTSDGYANTQLMAASNFPVAHYCVGLNINGYTDWYLPALDEVTAFMVNIKPSTTTIAAFKAGGSQVLTSGRFWSSTSGAFSSGARWYDQTGQNNVYDYNVAYPVRAIRRVQI